MAIRKVTYTEEELVALLKQNSEAGFRYLYDNYAGAIYTNIIKLVKDEERANDLMQDVFVKIWKNMQNYNPDKGRLYTWMLNIAKNSSIDFLRLVENKIEIQDISTAVYEVDGRISEEIALTQSEMQELVSKLRPDRKQLIDLAYFEGYTQEEIAKNLAIPLGTVKTRMRSALQELRNYLSSFVLIILYTLL